MTTLVPVVVKRSRISSAFKYCGGVLNPHKQYYVRRKVMGNQLAPTMNVLKDHIAKAESAH